MRLPPGFLDLNCNLERQNHDSGVSRPLVKPAEPKPSQFKEGQVIDSSDIISVIRGRLVTGTNGRPPESLTILVELSDGYEAFAEPVNDARFRITEIMWRERGTD